MGFIKKLLKKSLPAVVGAITGNPWLAAAVGAKKGGLKGALGGFLSGGGTVGGGDFGNFLTKTAKTFTSSGPDASDLKSLSSLVGKDGVKLKDLIKPVLRTMAAGSPQEQLGGPSLKDLRSTVAPPIRGADIGPGGGQASPPQQVQTAEPVQATSAQSVTMASPEYLGDDEDLEQGPQAWIPEDEEEEDYEMDPREYLAGNLFSNYFRGA